MNRDKDVLDMNGAVMSQDALVKALEIAAEHGRVYIANIGGTNDLLQRVRLYRDYCNGTIAGWPISEVVLLMNIHRMRYGNAKPSEKRICIYCGREKRITETKGAAFSLMSCGDLGRGASGPRCIDVEDCTAYQRLSRRNTMAVGDDKQARDTANAQPMRAMSDEEIIDQLFTYHAPDQQQQQHLQAVRMAAKHLGHVILASVPPGADRSAAIRKLRESVMTANAAIVLRGGPNFY